MAGFIITRIHVGDYDTWRQMFEQDHPRAREKATAVRVFRRVDDPAHVDADTGFPSGRPAGHVCGCTTTRCGRGGLPRPRRKWSKKSRGSLPRTRLSAKRPAR